MGVCVRMVLMTVMLVFSAVLAAPKGTEIKIEQGKLELNLIKATTPVMQQQVAALWALEKRAAAARDYDTAIAARSARQKLESELSAQEKLALLLVARQVISSPEVTERIILKPADATLDRVRFDKSAGVLTDWTVGSSATWKLPELPPGGYEVVLRYASGALEGGSVVVQEAFFNLTHDLTTTLKGFIEDNIGTLKVRDGSGIFKISAKTVLKGNLMQLQSVELIPANR
jgi:hypothetical protein